MKELQTTFQEYALRSELPLPDQALQLRASGSLISYQGNLTDDVVSQTGFKGSSYDDEYESYPVYVLSTNKKDFQFLNYLEDGVNLISSSFTQVLAEPEYGLLFPKIFGKPLWVFLFSDTQKPIHLSYSWSYDIINGTGQVIAYMKDSYFLDPLVDSLWQMSPQNSCKRILELWYSHGTGIYTISPNGSTKIQVYCDMEIDWGGWTMVARSIVWGTGALGWSTTRWNPADTTQVYSLWNTAFPIDFSSVMFARYTSWKNIDLALALDRSTSIILNPTGTGTFQSQYRRLVFRSGIPTAEASWNQLFPFTYIWNTSSTLRYWFQHTATPSWSYGLNPSGFVTGGYSSTYGSWNGKQGMIFIR